MKKLKFKQRLIFSLTFSVILFLGACNTSRTLRGGAIGAGAGGTIGGLIGSKSDNTAKGAILGAVIGGAAGALVGNYMDKQAEELRRDLEGASVERIGEGIKITFDSGILFGFDSSTLTVSSQENIMALAETLKKYEDTEVLIEGHTDDRGSEVYNQKLSEQRAGSVANLLMRQGVLGTRVVEQGYGELQPVADNATDEGRRLNRRVEVAIFANDKLKRAAKRGDIGSVTN